MYSGDFPMHQVGETCRFAQILVQLEVAQDIGEGSLDRRGRLEAQRVVFHLRHAFLIFRFRVGKEVGLHAIHLALSFAGRHGIHVDADEEIAVGATEERSVGEISAYRSSVSAPPSAALTARPEQPIPA
jgi:hypothetical protein